MFDEIESTRFPNITNHYQEFNDKIITENSNYCSIEMILLIFFRNDLERETNLRPTDLQLIRLQCYQDVDMRSLNFCSESPDSGLKK